MLRAALSKQFFAERKMVEPWPGFDDAALVEYRFERGLLTLTSDRDGLPAGHTICPHDVLMAVPPSPSIDGGP